MGTDILHSRRGRFVTALAAMLGLTSLPAAADTYTYSTLTTASDVWSTGSGWTGSVPPVSASNTTLQFGTGAAFAAGTGPTISSTNDLSGGLVNVNGQFELNALTTSYVNPAGAGNTAATINISGGPLLFLDDGLLTPVITLRSNSNSTGTIGQKAVQTLSNNLVLGSNKLTFNAPANNAGGVTTAVINVTGTLSYTTVQAHTLEFGGDQSVTASNTGNGRAAISTVLSDQSLGNATSVIKNGTSFWELTGANSYTGGTTVNNGVLRATQLGGMGSGNITVNAGGTAWLDAIGTHSNNFSIAGAGVGGAGAIRFRGGSTLASASTVTLTGAARIGAISAIGDLFTIDAQITGTGDLTFGIGSANSPRYVLNNSANDYVGSTTFSGENSTTTSGSSTSQFNVNLNNDSVISDGDLILSMGTRAAMTIDLRGFNQTVGGLISAGHGLVSRVITNGSVATTSTSTLTIGSNNSGGTYRGHITGTSTKQIALTKIGSGNQILGGTTSHYANTTISGGKLTLDYNLYSATQTASPTNQFSVNSTMVLNGGTLAIEGRAAGDAVSKTGTLAGRVFTLGAGQDLNGLVAGQLTNLVTSTSAPIFIQGIDRTANSVYFNEVASPTPTGFTTTAQTGTTTQTFKGLTVGASTAVNSTLDLGTTDGVVLTFNAFAQTNDGSTLTIDNWDGSLSGGGLDQLIFVGDTAAFQSLFTDSEISFAGYAPGYSVIDVVPGTSFEVVPESVPEPAGLSLIAVGALSLLRRRRRSR